MMVQVTVKTEHEEYAFEVENLIVIGGSHNGDKTTVEQGFALGDFKANLVMNTFIGNIIRDSFKKEKDK